MKCLFDNNMPSKLAKTLSFLEGDKGIPVIHLSEKYSPDTPDIGWIENLTKEADWFVITKDNKIRRNPHERKVWQESHIPMVFLPKSWDNYTLWEMAWRLIKYWPRLKETISHNRKNESLELSIKGKITVVG
jgi:hypothetical protein